MWKKIVVGLLIVSLVVVGVLGFAVYVAPTEYSVEREVTVNKTPEEVFAYAKLLKNQNEWGPWYKREPTMKQEYRGTDGEPGFVVSWKGGSETGEGEQEIKKVTEGKRLETELRFKKPFESSSNTYLTTDPAGEGQTKVKWGMNGSVPRPMNAMLLFFSMENAIGKDFEEGLATLKSKLESK